MDKKGIEIKTAEYGSEEYKGLRALWCEVFGDEPDYVDAFYENFGDDITGYVAADETGRVCSALTCHLCGTYGDRPVYVSYAVCTRDDMRGQGLAAELITFVRDRVTEAFLLILGTGRSSFFFRCFQHTTANIVCQFFFIVYQ